MKMLSAVYTLLIVCLISTYGYSQNHRLDFRSADWQELLKEARQENKMIMVFAITSWCGNSRHMAKEIFTNDTVADFFNTHFINTVVDIEKGEGVGLAKKYSIKSYPSYIFIDKEGFCLHRACGTRNTMEMIQVGKDAMNPAKQFSALEKRFNSGESGASFMLEYLNALAGNHTPLADIKTNYLRGLSDNELLIPANWKIICQFERDINSRELTYLFNNQEKFISISTRDSVENKIFKVFVSASRKCLEADDKTGFETIRKRIAVMNYSRKNELLMRLDGLYQEYETNNKETNK
ncbi:MAG: DUF255 domain-containing protein [Bacteroidetes bacterium]|nr:DUF255 domain-containing protein [Bacteroidota bacterium]